MGWQRETAIAARDYSLGLRDAANDALQGWHRDDAIEHEWTRDDVRQEAAELAGQFAVLWEEPLTDSWIRGACDQILDIIAKDIQEWKTELALEDEDDWKCPKCGYMITDTEMQALRFDYGCPRCKTSFGEFHPKPAEGTEQQVQADSPAGPTA